MVVRFVLGVVRGAAVLADAARCGKGLGFSAVTSPGTVYFYPSAQTLPKPSPSGDKSKLSPASGHAAMDKTVNVIALPVNHCGTNAAIIPPRRHKPALISRRLRNYIETWARIGRHEPDTGACQKPAQSNILKAKTMTALVRNTPAPPSPVASAGRARRVSDKRGIGGFGIGGQADAGNLGGTALTVLLVLYPAVASVAVVLAAFMLSGVAPSV